MFGDKGMAQYQNLKRNQQFRPFSCSEKTRAFRFVFLNILGANLGGTVVLYPYAAPGITPAPLPPPPPPGASLHSLPGPLLCAV